VQEEKERHEGTQHRRHDDEGRRESEKCGKDVCCWVLVGMEEIDTRPESGPESQQTTTTVAQPPTDQPGPMKEHNRRPEPMGNVVGSVNDPVHEKGEIGKPRGTRENKIKKNRKKPKIKLICCIKSRKKKVKEMMQQEVKLYNNPKEREMYENMADLYSIIKTTEALERAHMRDAINYEEYPPPSPLLFFSSLF
jgi:hypothetical protein